MRRRAQGSQPDPLAFKVGYGVDAFLGEQFDATRHRAGQHRYRLAGVDPNDIRRRKVETEIRLIGADRMPQERLCVRIRAQSRDVTSPNG